MFAAIGASVTAALAAGCGSSSTPAGSIAETAPAAMNDDRSRVLALIGAARVERGLPPVGVVEDEGQLAAAERALWGGASPDQAIRTALQRVVETEASDAIGWCLPTHDLQNLELPSEILERHEVYLSVVAIRRPPARGVEPLVVCLLVFEDGPEVPSTDG